MIEIHVGALIMLLLTAYFIGRTLELEYQRRCEQRLKDSLKHAGAKEQIEEQIGQ